MSPDHLVAAVVGHPVAHSLSPAMHNGEFRRRGFDGVYGVFDVEEAAFEDFLNRSRGSALRGLSVTMPLKDAAFDLVDFRDEFAQRSRSVNTITFSEDGRIRGSDTDGRGCVEALLRFGCSIEGERCMVLGAGGAARSIVVALDQAGARDVLVVNRTLSTAKAAAACAPSGRVGEPVDALTCRVIVNATPVGMGTDSVDATPLDAGFIPAGSCVLDAVYQPLSTRLLRDALARNAMAVDGLWMLVHQAALQQFAWFGEHADAEGMRASAEAELARR